MYATFLVPEVVLCLIGGTVWSDVMVRHKTAELLEFEMEEQEG
jgi:hypothetical protein